MDYASRMARAKEMGFDVDKPVYHGTKDDFTEFDPDRAIGTNFWSTNNKSLIEKGEVGAQGSGKIKEMYHRIENPAGWEEYDKFGTDELIARGYDGLALPDADGTITYSAFSPSQYRDISATFDPAQKESSNLLASLAPMAIGVGALSQSDNSSAANRARTSARASDLLGYTPEQRLEGVKRPLMGVLENHARAYNDYIERRPLLSLLAPEAPEELLNKLAYDDKRSYGDYFLANLGLMP